MDRCQPNDHWSPPSVAAARNGGVILRAALVPLSCTGLGCHSRPMNDRRAKTDEAYDTIAAEYASAAANRSSEAEAFLGRFTTRLRSGALVADLGWPGQAPTSAGFKTSDCV